MRWYFLILIALGAMIGAGVGFRGEKFSVPPVEIFPDMDRQYKLKAQKPSEFFADGVGSRKPVPGTVPIGFELPAGDDRAGEGTAIAEMGFTHADDYYNTGVIDDYYGDGFPEQIELDQALLDRGEERYNINCAICHGAGGNGQGVVAKLWTGFPPTANLVDPRVKALPDGQLFWTITHGKGLMGPYNGTITVQDRWAIVAYVRALQLGSGAEYTGPVKEAFDAAMAEAEAAKKPKAEAEGEAEAGEVGNGDEAPATTPEGAE